jgi:hypothetical protein
VSDVADLIAPGEKVLWRGHPTGYPFSCGAVLAYLVIVFLGGMPLFCISCDMLSTVLSYKLGLGIVTVTYDSLGDGILTSTVPSPLVGLVPIVLFEIWRTTAWWDRSFWITDRRLIETDRRGRRVTEMALSELRDVRAWDPDLEVTSHDGRILRFASIDDPENARAALVGAIASPHADKRSASSA